MSVTTMPTNASPTSADLATTGTKSKKKLLVILLVVVLLGGGGYWMFRPQPPAPPTPGEVVTLDPIQVNLAGEHYLRLGIALQLTDEATEADGSKALDAAIKRFSGLPVARVADSAKRAELQDELTKELDELYDGEVMDVYFTEFVTQ